MGRYGQVCNGCSGENCVCCEVYLEDKNNQQTDNEPDELEIDGEFIGDEDDYEDNMTDAEADADVFKSIGWGSDEDYGDFGMDRYDNDLGDYD
jgi:hypothetical protein